MLVPVGIELQHWFTAKSVADCRRDLKERSGLLGIQVYEATGSAQSPDVRVRYRDWLSLYQEAELVVHLEPTTSDAVRTAVRVTAGMRVGVLISLVAWAGFLTAPLVIFPTVPTKVFFAVVLFLPIASALIITRVQIRRAISEVRMALPRAG